VIRLLGRKRLDDLGQTLRQLISAKVEKTHLVIISGVDKLLVVHLPVLRASREAVGSEDGLYGVGLGRLVSLGRPLKAIRARMRVSEIVGRPVVLKWSPLQ
jgi:hypothetical protein